MLSYCLPALMGSLLIASPDFFQDLVISVPSPYMTALSKLLSAAAHQHQSGVLMLQRNHRVVSVWDHQLPPVGVGIAYDYLPATVAPGPSSLPGGPLAMPSVRVTRHACRGGHSSRLPCGAFATLAALHASPRLLSRSPTPPLPPPRAGPVTAAGTAARHAGGGGWGRPARRGPCWPCSPWAASTGPRILQPSPNRPAGPHQPCGPLATPRRPLSQSGTTDCTRLAVPRIAGGPASPGLATIRHHGLY